MVFPCEVVIKSFGPALKAETAAILDSKYSFTQTQIAAELCITQAAVSKDLAGKHSHEVKDARSYSSVKQTASRLAESIASGRKPLALIPADSICAFCREKRRNGFKMSEARGGLRISSSCDLK